MALVRYLVLVFLRLDRPKGLREIEVAQRLSGVVPRHPLPEFRTNQAGKSVKSE